MNKIKKPYKRLKGPRIIGANSLYMGSDHLLSVTSSFFSEDYRRFYFQDIQAFVTRKTSRGRILNICFGISALIFIAAAFYFTGRWADTFAAIFLLLLIINLIKGTTSVCHILTPIQTTRLPALKRVRHTKRALEKLRKAIENVQGVLTQDQIQSAGRAYDEQKAYMQVPRFFKREKGIFHLILFAILLADALTTAIGIFNQGDVLHSISLVIFIATIVFIIVSLIKQSGSTLYYSIKALTWTIAGYLSVIFISSFILVFYIMSTMPDTGDILQKMEQVAELRPLENPWILGLSVVNVAFSLILGIFGLLLIFRYRKELQSHQNNSKTDNTLSEGSDNE